jgi:hypothetical protein
MPPVSRPETEPIVATPLDRASLEAWQRVVEQEFARVVDSLRAGKLPSELRCSEKEIVPGEWQAVLEAARRALAKDLGSRN